MGCSTTTVSNETEKKKFKDNGNNKDDDSGVPERIPGQKQNFQKEDEPFSEIDGQYEEVN